MATCSPWDQYPGASPGPGAAQHHQAHDVLTMAYENVLAQLVAASAIVAGIGANLQGVTDGQTDVSARLSGRPSRCAGKKRKLSPCIYDYSEDLGFYTASARADTPTQELLPASRSELRNTQLQAVRWLTSLERQGASGVLADELEADRRAEVAGLLAHLAANPPEQQMGGGSGGGSGCANACLLLAPGCSLESWRDVITGHVDVVVHLHDGSPASGVALQAACCAAGVSLSSVPVAPAGPGPSTGGRRSASGGAFPGAVTTSTAAGVHPPSFQQQQHYPNQHQHLHPGGPPPPYGSLHSSAAAKLPPQLLVVLAPLEQLQRDVPLLAQLPARLAVVDLAPPAGRAGTGSNRSGAGGGVEDGSGGSGRSGGSSGDRLPFSLRLGGLGPAAQQEVGSRGMDLAAHPQLQLLTRMPSISSRVILSAGEPAPAGGSIWLLLQLLAPHVQQPLWGAVNELQAALLAAGSVGAQCKEDVLAEVHAQLWGLVRPLVLHRRAHDVDLASMRGAATSLNLFDHFSSVRADRH